MDYNKVAKEYDNYGKEAITDWAIAYPAVIDEIMPLKGKRVLDYGCGTGKVSRALRDKGADVIGADISEEILRITKAYENEGILFRQIRNGDLSFIKANYLDSVISTFVFCNVASRSDIESALGEIYRVLKPGGKIVILNANWEHCNGMEFISYKFDSFPSLEPGQKVTLMLKSSKPFSVVNYFWGEKDYTDALRKCGFGNIAARRPLGAGGGIAWMGEDKYPLYLIVSAVK